MFAAGVEVGVVDSTREGELGSPDAFSVGAPNGLALALANRFGFSALANELVFARLANRLGFSAAAKEVCIVEEPKGFDFSADAASPNVDLKFESNKDFAPCASGLASSSPALGSRWNADCSLKG